MSTQHPRTVWRSLDSSFALDFFREVVVTGVAAVVPLFVTMYVLVVVANFFSQAFEPLNALLPGDMAVVVACLTLFVFLVGAVGRSARGETALDRVDSAVGSIPAVGTVYGSFRSMSDAVLENGAENFSDVKLVEFPNDGIYTVAFETNDAPENVRTATHEESMSLLFVPMAPNPVMGGFVVAVPTDKVTDVDMTMEEAFRTIVTSGVASGDHPATGGSYAEEFQWVAPERVGQKSRTPSDDRQSER